MDTSKKIKMTVTMEVTIPQAVALQAMFKYWNALGSMGSSRDVGFRVDGDGNFQPGCKFEFSQPVPELTDELEKTAISSEEDGDRLYDFDSIACKFRYL